MNAVKNRELPIVFGAYEQLVGILRRPRPQQQDYETAVILLTAGMMHSSGPFRLHVDLARALGNTGLYSLRFDLSGIGESLAIGSTGTSLERAASEVSSAIDYLQEHYGLKRFGLFGLCSGADDALYAATQDDRIGAVFSLDGLGYPTTRFYFHRFMQHYLPKLLSARKTWQLSRRLLGLERPAPESLQQGDDIREFPAKPEALRQIQQLLQRGVHMHFHYTGGVDYYSYPTQFYDMFPSLRAMASARNAGRITHSFNPASDHVGFLCEHRADIVARVCRHQMEFAESQEGVCK
ncbi:MAG: lipase [Pirellulaceae bacterium]